MAPFIHLFFETLGYFAAYRLYRRLKNAAPDILSAKVRFRLFLAAGAGAFLVARIGTLVEPGLGFVGAASSCGTGKTIVGGFVGGLLGVEIAKAWLRIREATGDLYTFPIIAGLIIGRIGCHFSGTYDCTYGVPIAASMFGWDFGDGQNRIPWSLYEIIFLLALGSLLYWQRQRLAQRQGRSFKLFLISYFLFRLVVDTWKPLLVDPVVGLTLTQWLALFGTSFYLLKDLIASRLINKKPVDTHLPSLPEPAS